MKIVASVHGNKIRDLILGYKIRSFLLLALNVSSIGYLLYHELYSGLSRMNFCSEVKHLLNMLWTVYFQLVWAMTTSSNYQVNNSNVVIIIERSVSLQRIFFR